MVDNKIINKIKLLLKDLWEKCPNCDDTGVVIYYGTNTVELEQCEFCYRNEASIFNQSAVLKLTNEMQVEKLRQLEEII
jgi:hypothetical protein